VGVLWITGGLMQDIPHRESTFTITTMFVGSSDAILTFFMLTSPKKLVDANIKKI
jgi:hypothetical protein